MIYEATTIYLLVLLYLHLKTHPRHSFRTALITALNYILPGCVVCQSATCSTENIMSIYNYDHKFRKSESSIVDQLVISLETYNNKNNGYKNYVRNLFNTVIPISKYIYIWLALTENNIKCNKIEKHGQKSCQFMLAICYLYYQILPTQ